MAQNHLKVSVIQIEVDLFIYIEMENVLDYFDLLEIKLLWAVYVAFEKCKQEQYISMFSNKIYTTFI